MLYRPMPKTGELLSILGYGCMRLPMAEGQIDEPRAIAQIRSAIDEGVNYVDTAWGYHGGTSEPLLGKALQDGYRARVKIATKLPSWLIHSRADMDAFLNAQMQRLETDHIDYYLIHSLHGTSWSKLQALGINDFLDKALQDGRIGNAGFSFHGLAEDFPIIVDSYPWTFCQIQYNYLDQQYQAGTAGLKYASSKGLGVVIMEPLRGGNLGLPNPPAAIEAIWDQAVIQRTPVEWAFRWVWNHPEVTVVISGMNAETHIAQNLAIASDAYPDSLTGEELDLVDQAASMYQQLMQVGCTGCGYCMPCPAGVQIPKCFDFYNKLHMFGNVQESRFMYVAFVSGLVSNDPPGYASQCVACGECLEKCPQSIAIPDFLEKVAAEMEGQDFPDFVAMVQQHLKVS